MVEKYFQVQICLCKVREKQNVYGVFFPLFIFYFEAHNMRWKKLTLVFDENASFSFHVINYKKKYYLFALEN